jgi:signal transduction histidine kinase
MSLAHARRPPFRRHPACVSMIVAALAAAGVGAGLAGLAANGTGTLDAAAGLAAGWILVATGLLEWARSAAPRGPAPRSAAGSTGRRPVLPGGLLLAAAGLAWLAAGWNTPAIGFAPAFGAGLTLYAAAPPLLAHAALAFPGRRLSRVEAGALGLAYASAIGVLGVGSALVFDPATQGCASCPANPFLVADASGAYTGLNTTGIWLAIAWAPALIVLLVVQLARCGPALRAVKGPLTVSAACYLALVTWDGRLSLGAGFYGAHLHTAEAATLAAASAAVWWTWLAARRTRGAMARLVVEVAAAPAPGRLRDMLAARLGDPTVRLAYPLPDGRVVDADGRPVTLDGQPAGTVTPLSRDGREIALVTHRAGLFDDPALVGQIVAGSSLALENERLQAELNARLSDLRASRARVAEAADAERRRRERDLHDGAHQHLTALLFAVGSARARSDSAALEQAEAELLAAAAELRDLARGVFPAVLADEGLAAAVQSLAEQAPVRIIALPARRLRPAVETAAYFVIARAVPESGELAVTAAVRDCRLEITLEGAADLGGARDLSGARDRVAAQDGDLAADGNGLIRVSLPCE